MKIIKKPTKRNAGIGIDRGKVYHFILRRWFPCGDCKVTDKHIQDAIKREYQSK